MLTISSRSATALMLPMSTPWEVKRPDMTEATEAWKDIVTDTFAEIKSLITIECEKLTDERFSRFLSGGLGSAVKWVKGHTAGYVAYTDICATSSISASLDKLIDHQESKTLAFLADLVKMESTIYTLDDATFLQRRTANLEAYQKARKSA